jgi:cytochrome c-type biogenesis protein CcmH/NrfG
MSVEAERPAPAGETNAFREAVKLHESGRHAEAEALLAKALAETPQDLYLWNVRGVTLRALRRNAEAIWCFRQALAISADRAAVWSNLGNALKDLKHTHTAIACHRRAIALQPDDAGAQHNLGIALTVADRHVEALAAFDRALEIDPGNHRVRWDRARAHLHLGDYARGWADYESRLLTGQLPERQFPGERWTGARYDGKRLLIISEQGMGDALWIARYLRRVKAQGGELVMECRPETIPLLASLGVCDRLVPKRDPLPEADFHLNQCSLPGLYTPSLKAIPAAPYFAAEPERRAKFVAAMAEAKGRLRVGIVWSGSTTFQGNRDRAVPLRMFLQWFALPGVQLFSLQKGPPEKELEGLPQGAPIVDLAPLIADFADTAAAIAEVDLVLMTDSAVAHLAGAMGRPVWVLLGRVPHWLWLLERSDSPWYPSMRLFRQRAWGDWTGAFDEAAAALLQWSLSRR